MATAAVTGRLIVCHYSIVGRVAGFSLKNGLLFMGSMKTAVVIECLWTVWGIASRHLHWSTDTQYYIASILYLLRVGCNDICTQSRRHTVLASISWAGQAPD